MQTTSKTSDLVEQLATERRRVDFDSYDITVQQLLAMVADGQIDVAPTYQRRFRWLPPRQSQLIESILLGIPVPNLFMATNRDGTWEVVDGVQRLSTVVHFAGDPKTREKLRLSSVLRVEALDKISALNGRVFSDLPLSVQTQFRLRPLKVTTLNDKSDMKVRFDLFERLNTGGLALTDQEIRGCIYRGRFNDFLEEMAGNGSFKKMVILKETAEQDGTREEHVLRFFAFLERYQSFDHSVVGFLNDFMADASKTFDYTRGRREFENTFAELARVFPSGIKRSTRLTPVNLYEAVAVGAALALRTRKRLDARGADGWIRSDELKKLTTGATNNKNMVLDRINFVATRFGAFGAP